jgi:TIGR03009 family protein
MRQSNRLSRFIAAIVAGAAPFFMTFAAMGQQSPGAKVQRPQSTAGARATGSPDAPAARPAQNGNTGRVKQTAKALPVDEGKPAPKKDAAAIPPSLQMPKELDNILSDWERHTAELKKLQGDFSMYKYDTVFETETRADGTFWYQKPDKGRMDLHKPDPKTVLRNAANQPVSGKKNLQDDPYKFKEKSPETWVCTGEVIRKFDHGSEDNAEKTYSEVVIPEKFQGEEIRNSPLPFLFGLKKEEAKRRYVLNLGDMHNTVPKGLKSPIIHIVAHPLEERDAREWSRAEILLHSDTFLPHAIRTFDPADSGETVYSFKRIDSSPNWLLDNPFTVNPIGYKLLQKENLDKDIAPIQRAAGGGGTKLFDKPKGANPLGRDRADQ